MNEFYINLYSNNSTNVILNQEIHFKKSRDPEIDQTKNIILVSTSSIKCN